MNWLQIQQRINKTDSCWLWTGTRTHGHASMKDWGKTTVYIHRYMWERTNGKIPYGMILHHKCSNKHCVNPEHLELTTRSKHPDAAHAKNAVKTKCPYGHEYTVENTYINPKTGNRSCLSCRNTNNEMSNARRKRTRSVPALSAGSTTVVATTK